MTIKNLFTLFGQGVNWNALFYIVYKAASTVITVLLFKYLTSQDFSTWANINSIIFLTLLWLDFGFRKSIPRYCPEFAKNKDAQKRFVKTLIIFQILVLIIATPIMMYILKTSLEIFHLQNNFIFFYLGALIFLLEGVVTLLRLIYHAHFWIKQFNIVTTISLLAEVIANICVIFLTPDSLSIIKYIFVTKIISSACINAIGICMLPRLYRDRNYPGDQEINYSQTMHQFIKHSSIMWINNNLKSLSERNFLVPFFTYILGATYANLFKVANDAALFFYRIVLKTIGTTDTALLSHIETSNATEKLMPIAFKKLLSKIAGLVFPVLGVLCVLLLKSDLIFQRQFVFQTFFIMTIGYLIEMIVSPYERILEIKRRYGLLFIAYMPYVLMIVVLLSFNFISFVGLVYSLIIIHGVRLVSSFIMVYLARINYALIFPIKHIAILILIYTPLILTLFLILTFYPTLITYVSI